MNYIYLLLLCLTPAPVTHARLRGEENVKNLEQLTDQGNRYAQQMGVLQTTLNTVYRFDEESGNHFYGSTAKEKNQRKNRQLGNSLLQEVSGNNFICASDADLCMHTYGGTKGGNSIKLHGNLQYAKLHSNSQYDLIPYGEHLLICASDADLCMHTYGGTKEGNDIKLHGNLEYAKKHANSQYKLVPHGNYFIICASDADLCLHTYGGSTFGKNIQLHGNLSYAKKHANSQYSFLSTDTPQNIFDGNDASNNYQSSIFYGVDGVPDKLKNKSEVDWIVDTEDVTSFLSTLSSAATSFAKLKNMQSLANKLATVAPVISLGLVVASLFLPEEPDPVMEKLDKGFEGIRNSFDKLSEQMTVMVDKIVAEITSDSAWTELNNEVGNKLNQVNLKYVRYLGNPNMVTSDNFKDACTKYSPYEVFTYLYAHVCDGTCQDNIPGLSSAYKPFLQTFKENSFLNINTFKEFRDYAMTALGDSMFLYSQCSTMLTKGEAMDNSDINSGNLSEQEMTEEQKSDFLIRWEKYNQNLLETLEENLSEMTTALLDAEEKFLDVQKEFHDHWSIVGQKCKKDENCHLCHDEASEWYQYDQKKTLEKGWYCGKDPDCRNEHGFKMCGTSPDECLKDGFEYDYFGRQFGCGYIFLQQDDKCAQCCNGFKYSNFYGQTVCGSKELKGGYREHCFIISPSRQCSHCLNGHSYNWFLARDECK